MNLRMTAAPVRSVAAATAVLAAAGSLVLAAFAAPVRTWSNLLVDGYCLLSLGLGGMIFVVMQQLTGARWPASVRRSADALTAVLPIGGLMLLSLFFGRSALYPWSLAPDRYLSTAMVFSRMVVFLATWLLFARLLRRGRPIHSALFAIVFAVSFSIATVDWLLSVTPHWSTTMFAVYHFAGVLVEGTAAVTFVAALQLDRPRFQSAVSDDDLHDLGKLLFAFPTLWAYLWLSQYLLIWYTNLPEETSFYLARLSGPWRPWFFLNLFVNWVVPFVVLLARGPKRRPTVLKWVAVVLFVGRWLDIYLTVMPQTTYSAGPGVLELTMAVGCAGLVVAAVSSTLVHTNGIRHA